MTTNGMKAGRVHETDETNQKEGDVVRKSLGRIVASVVFFLVGSCGSERSVAGQGFSALRGRMEALLREELTRDWYPRAVDRDRGGFHQSFARDWSPMPDRGYVPRIPGPAHLDGGGVRPVFPGAPG